jgi:nucleoside-diphosphate-sugar epimerase
MKNIAIIGCGWLGSELAKALLKKNYTVHGSSRKKERLQSLIAKGLIPHQMNYADFSSAQAWMHECDILVLNIPPSDFKFLYAEKMVEVSKNMKKDAQIIFISSTSVYANNDGIVTEKTKATGGPRNGKWVLDAEERLADNHKNNLTIIRMSGLIGGERHPVKYMSEKEYEFGGNPVNLIHRDDCVGLIELVINKNIRGKIINGVCEENPTRKDYYTFAAEQLNLAPPVFLKTEAKGFKQINSEIMNEIGYKMKYQSPFEFPINE